MCLQVSAPSIRRRGRSSSGSSISSAYALMRARNSGTRAASIVRPAACLWPPNRRNRSAQRSSAASMSKAGMLRHDPCATSPSTDSTIAGLWNASTSFEATMPMTPRCQPSPPTTRTLCAPIAGSVSIAFFACGDDLRFLLLPAQVLVVELLGQRRALRRPSPRRWPAAGASRCRACSCGRRR